MAVAGVEHSETRSPTAADPRSRLLQAALLALRAGPALILLLLVVVVLWAASGTLIAGMPNAVDMLGGGTIDWLPYSFFVAVGLALVALVVTTYPDTGTSIITPANAE
jgi:hypothetical protein